MKPEIQATIQRLRDKEFRPDPIAGEHYSRVVSVMSSAYKRHGFIIERTILERLKMSPNFDVWEDREFQVTNTADHIVDTAILNPETILSTETSYRDGHRTLQVDAIVFDKRSNSIRAYEIKRGSGLHDSGKRRSILRDLLCMQILLKSYGEHHGYKVKKASSHIVFYYGQCSIKKPFSITKDELDDHFDYPILKDVELVNKNFKKQLHKLLEE